MIKRQKEQITNEILRIIYWIRRYGGRRSKEYDKIWRGEDFDLLERRIKEYIENPKKFKFGNPDMGIDY